VGFERYVIEQSRNKKGSWQQVIPAGNGQPHRGPVLHRNRMCWGYGEGILALVNGAVNNSATVTVDAPGNVAGTVMGNRYLYGDATSGMFVAFLDAANNIEATGTITGVSAGGTQITLDGNVTLTDNDKIVSRSRPRRPRATRSPRASSRGSTTAPTSAPTTTCRARPTRSSSRTSRPAVGALSLDAIQQPIDAVSIKVGKTIDFFACEHAVRRAYLALLEADRRYTGADLMSPDGGTKAAKKPTGRNITYGDIPIVVDRDAPYRMLFGVNKASWTRYVMNEGQWADDEGHVLKWVSDYDQWTAYFYILDNFHCQTAEPELPHGRHRRQPARGAQLLSRRLDECDGPCLTRGGASASPVVDALNVLRVVGRVPTATECVRNRQFADRRVRRAMDKTCYGYLNFTQS
jgi:hypothetical protein